MGEANLRFVRGDRDTAVRMCMEVIRQVSYVRSVPQLPVQPMFNLKDQSVVLRSE